MKKTSRSRKNLKKRLWNGGTLEPVSPTERRGCHWCKEPHLFKDLTLEHHPPQCISSQSKIMFLACAKCNNEKDKELSQFINRLRLINRILLSFLTKGYCLQWELYKLKKYGLSFSVDSIFPLRS